MPPWLGRGADAGVIAFNQFPFAKETSAEFPCGPDLLERPREQKAGSPSQSSQSGRGDRMRLRPTKDRMNEAAQGAVCLARQRPGIRAGFVQETGLGCTWKGK